MNGIVTIKENFYRFHGDSPAIGVKECEKCGRLIDTDGIASYVAEMNTSHFWHEECAPIVFAPHERNTKDRV